MAEVWRTPTAHSKPWQVLPGEIDCNNGRRYGDPEEALGACVRARWVQLACVVLGLSACDSGTSTSRDPELSRGGLELPPVGSAIIHTAPGLPPGEYVVVGSSPGIITGSRVTAYEQMHLGYAVPGFGYFVTTKDGVAYGKNGKYIDGLPNAWPKPMSESAALAFAMRELAINGPPPWVAKPGAYHAPKATLAWTTTRSLSNPQDYVLAWCFNLQGAGLGFLGITLDAVTGKLVMKQPGIIE